MQIVKAKKATAGKKSDKSAERQRREMVEKRLENPAKRPPPKTFQEKS